MEIKKKAYIFGILYIATAFFAFYLTRSFIPEIITACMLFFIGLFIIKKTNIIN